MIEPGLEPGRASPPPSAVSAALLTCSRRPIIDMYAVESSGRVSVRAPFSMARNAMAASRS